MSFFRRVFGKNEEADESEQYVDQDATPVVPMPQVKPSFNPEARTTVFDTATRELVSEPENMLAGHSVMGYVSDVGIVRDNNEDATFTFFASSSTVDNNPDFGIFIIADGMGGHQQGEKASALAVRTSAQLIMQKLYLPMLTAADDPDRPPIAEVLIAAVKAANDAVIKSIADGGTTLTIMVMMGDWGHFAHVGDSRAYLITKEAAELVTRDHSYVQRLIELNQISVEESRQHPQRNVLYRAIGQNEVIDVDTLSRRLPTGGAILLCSDGMWDVVSNHQIREIVSTNSSPQQICEKLVALAITQGSTDNVSGILVRMPG